MAKDTASKGQVVIAITSDPEAMGSKARAPMKSRETLGAMASRARAILVRARAVLVNHVLTLATQMYILLHDHEHVVA